MQSNDIGYPDCSEIFTQGFFNAPNLFLTTPGIQSVIVKHTMSFGATW